MIYTKYGSLVEIEQAYTQQRDMGKFLVRARIVEPSSFSNTGIEQAGSVVAANDSFHKGWISSNELVADGGRTEIINACLGAQSATPPNVETLLRLYWPETYGPLELVDEQRGQPAVGLIRKMLPGGAGVTGRRVA